MGNRTDVVAGVSALLDTFSATNPSLLVRHFTVRPPSLVTDLPCAFMDIGGGTIHYDNSLREWIFPVGIVFVDRLTDNEETDTRGDVLADAFMDLMDATPHVVAGTWWSDATWTSDPQTLGGDGDPQNLAGYRLTFDIHFLRGRV